MNDPYPSTLNVDVDRNRLGHYLRVKWLLAWALPLSFFGALFGLASTAKALDDDAVSNVDSILLVAKCFIAGIGISLFIALFCYFLFSHWLAARVVGGLDVSVEGAFLRIRQHGVMLSDRKLHFRSIVSYATTQDFLMRRFGIWALQMTTTAGGQNGSIIIPGVKDCLRVRDVLSEIDRLRENQ